MPTQDAVQVSLTRRLAEYVTGLEFAALAPHTVEHAQQAVLDLVGLALRARVDSATSAAAARAVSALDPGGACTGIGYGSAYSAPYAALLNGCNFHVLDFDDTHERASLHPGAPVIAAALAMAEYARIDGRTFIAAVVAGYDVAVRVGLAALPGVHYARGFHPTATAGVFGATAAVARLMGSSPEVLTSAFGIALSTAAGSLQFSVDGAQTKPLQVGFAAHNAILAYRFAANGVRGPDEAFEGRSGFLHAYTDGADPAELLDRWDGVHEIDRTAFKPYPCCRYMHAAIDTVVEIVRERAIAPDAIERIRISLPAAGLRLCAHPEEQKRRVHSVVDAQFSIYYAAAAAALWGGVRWDDYARRDAPEIAALIERVTVTEDPEVEALFPRMAARVEIDAGDVHERRLTPSPRGEPDRPLGWDELIAKFHDLNAVWLPAPKRDGIVAAIRNLTDCPNLATLVPLLA
jgi:2-methylcitrate dehydratase PrpD